jgi:hypothetical protein
MRMHLLAAAAGLAACVASEPQPAPEVELEEVGLPAGQGWDESRAVAAEPCGGVALEVCESASRGACGSLALPEGDVCLPRFNWGVRDDGEVELASSERVFTLEELADAPLSDAEEAEAAQLFEDLAVAVLDSDAGNQRSISHSGMCSTSYASCYSGTPYARSATYYYHLNVPLSGGRQMHRHILQNWDAHRTPWGCNRFRLTGTTAVYCGTIP